VPLRAISGLTIAGALVLSAGPARAQSAQRYAVQIAALFTTINASGSSAAGAGVEPQFRINRIYATEAFGALSLGVGAQYTVHNKAQDRLQIKGVFLEPRWVPPIGSTRVFPYLSARLALMQVHGNFQFAEGGTSTGSGFGAGGGLAVALTRTTNLDAGVQLVRQQFARIGTVTFLPFTTYTAKVGLTVGFPQ
jgi:hypothetical protein